MKRKKSVVNLGNNIDIIKKLFLIYFILVIIMKDNNLYIYFLKLL